MKVRPVDNGGGGGGLGMDPQLYKSLPHDREADRRVWELLIKSQAKGK